MPSSLSALLDPGALIVVIAGTLLAATARCGTRDVAEAMRALLRVGSRPFNADANRAPLARSIAEIRERGHLCASKPLPPDPSMAALVEHYLVNGSIDAIHALARADRSQREIMRARAVRVFDYSGRSLQFSAWSARCSQSRN